MLTSVVNVLNYEGIYSQVVPASAFGWVVNALNIEGICSVDTANGIVNAKNNLQISKLYITLQKQKVRKIWNQ